MSETKLYSILFHSDAARDRMLEPELNGVAWLTAEQTAELQERGNSILENCAGEFDLTPVKPYTFDKIMATLPKQEDEDNDDQS